MTTEDPYVDIAPFYDLEFEPFSADIDLYLGYADAVGGPVLELGCGTGRVLLPIVEAGYDGYGIDNSPSMIERAQARFDRAHLEHRVSLEVREMAELDSVSASSPFRLVFSTINSFLHLASRAEQMRTLTATRSVIDRDGLLVLDVFHPTPETLMRMDDHYTFDASWDSPSGERVERFSHRQVDPASQIISTTLFYDVIAPDGSVHRRTTSYLTRYIHRFEMEGLLEATGFEIEGVYGSYALDPLEHDSEQMIFVAHRTANPGEHD